jgi:hypothetical protein
MPQKSTRRFALILLLLLLVVGVVFVLRQRRSRATDTAAAGDRAVTRTTTDAASTVAPPVNVERSSATAQAPAAEANFAAELDQARGYRDPRLRSSEVGRILRAWLQADPNGALAYVRAWPMGNDRSQAVLVALQSIGQSDPDRALSLARELVRNREDAAIYSVLFSQLAEKDPVAAAQRLSSVGDRGREKAVRALADAWARRDSTAARSWAEQLSGDDRRFAVESVALSLVEQDPLRGIELAQKYLDGASLDHVLTTALPKLGETDASAAAAIVALLPAGETQVLAAGDVARRLAARNPSEALTWARSLSDARAQQVASNNVLDIWATTAPRAAEQYVAQLEPGPVQTAAIEHLARTIGTHSANEAVAWVQALPSGSARDAAVPAVASAWAQHDPAAATRWASSLPVTAAQTEALNGALSYWLLKDGGAAENFVTGLSGEMQVKAAVSIAPQLAQTDPVSAMAWAQGLSSDAARAAASSAAFERWHENAPAAAETWLASANVAPELKARLLRKP